MAIDVKTLEGYISSGLSVIITGQAGTGKTAMLQQATENLGWKMKYYSTPTLDPFSDLIGIPVPNNGRKTVDYYRPRELDACDCVFFDELNRADLMVLNTIFEILQFKSINGEKLPNLKACVAAINPVEDGYATRQLDRALLDRFDLQLESDPNPNVQFFVDKYGESYARAGLELYYEYRKAQNSGAELDYFSPRRLDKLLNIYQQFRSTETIKGVLPSIRDFDGINIDDWSQKLNVSQGFVASEPILDLDARLSSALAKIGNDFIGNPYVTKDIQDAYFESKRLQHALWPDLRRAIAMALNQYIKSPEQVGEWGDIISDFSYEEYKALTHHWTTDKTAVSSRFTIST